MDARTLTQDFISLSVGASDAKGASHLSTLPVWICSNLAARIVQGLRLSCRLKEVDVCTSYEANPNDARWDVFSLFPRTDFDYKPEIYTLPSS
ncbi:hypothetical protein BN2476_490099 [Paraburkholderia piptadeniae]|uniref:Uncharacterized protein n=1 Tax=Paraburkholderia piptadeniae TaxID=1701573 RepID=A0A1N7SF80_9BURK|nr:hypothetical protein BN2476_490099 [Paraburkholderia piptadeniae]